MYLNCSNYTVTYSSFLTIHNNFKQQNVEEFTSLIQGNMSVEQYVARLMELGRSTSHLIGTENIHVKKFQGGLQQRICNQVAYFQIENQQELVNVIAIVEAKQRGVTNQINSERKRVFPYVAGGSIENKRMITEANKGKGHHDWETNANYTTIFGKCDRKHRGKCILIIRVYFKYGQLSQMIRDFPNNAQGSGTTPKIDREPNPRPQVPVQVYAVTPGNVETYHLKIEEVGVITGIYVDIYIYL